MKKLMTTILALAAIAVLLVPAACQNRAEPSATVNPPAFAGPDWEVGPKLTYGPQCISGDILVALEFNPAGAEQGRPQQSIVVYDLRTRQRKQVIDPPPGKMTDVPSISGSKIVFAAVDQEEFFRFAVSSKIEAPPNYDVFLFDLETNQMRQLTTEEHSQSSPRISGDNVIWLDARRQTLDRYPPSFDVYALDLKTGQEQCLTANPTFEGYSQLAISGNLVVWADMRHAGPDISSHPSNDPEFNNEIYLYDLAAGGEERITFFEGNDREPAIDGQRIVWIRQEDYLKADVFMYDLNSKSETRVSHTGYAESSPSISGEEVVWTDASSSEGNTDNDVIMNGRQPGSIIVLSDLLTQKESELTPPDIGKVWLYPVIQGNHVVYLWSRQIGALVYAFDLPDLPVATAAGCPALAVYMVHPYPGQKGVNYTRIPVTIAGWVNQPEARVTVNGVAATVKPDGNYSASIPLKEGTNGLKAEARLGDKTDEITYIVGVNSDGTLFPVPGLGAGGDRYSPHVSFEQPVVVPAGGMKSIDVFFEARKGSRTAQAINYNLVRIIGPSSDNIGDLPPGLFASIEPSSFSACPNTTYHSFLTLKTEASLPPGEYTLMLKCTIGQGGSIGSPLRVQITPAP